VGDQVTGLFPARSRRPRLLEELELEYDYGLTLFELHGERHISILRDGVKQRLVITPELIDGGALEGWDLSGERASEFFKLPGGALCASWAEGRITASESPKQPQGGPAKAQTTSLRGRAVRICLGLGLPRRAETL
jgi:hypothetical protein